MNGTVTIVFTNGAEKQFPDATNIVVRGDVEITFDQGGQSWRFLLSQIAGYGLPITKKASV